MAFDPKRLSILYLWIWVGLTVPWDGPSPTKTLVQRDVAPATTSRPILLPGEGLYASYHTNKTCAYFNGMLRR